MCNTAIQMPVWGLWDARVSISPTWSVTELAQPISPVSGHSSSGRQAAVRVPIEAVYGCGGVQTPAPEILMDSIPFPSQPTPQNVSTKRFDEIISNQCFVNHQLTQLR